MKTRLGFVSNSSSTSFLVLGMNTKKVYKLLQKIIDDYNKDNGEVKLESILSVKKNTKEIKKEMREMQEIYGITDAVIENTKVIIDSIDSNSIPWEIQEAIPNEFYRREGVTVERQHWG